MDSPNNQQSQGTFEVSNANDDETQDSDHPSPLSPPRRKYSEPPQTSETRPSPAQGRRGTGWVGTDTVVKLIHEKAAEKQQASTLSTIAEDNNETSSPREDAQSAPFFASRDQWKVSPVSRRRPLEPQEDASVENSKVVQSAGSSAKLLRIRSARENDEEGLGATNAHAIPWEQVVAALETNAVVGLSSSESAKRLQQFGRNKLAEAKPEPFWHKVFRQINSILIYILLISAAIAGGFQDWAEFGLILGVVAVNVIIGLIQEGKAERATLALKAMMSSKATVIRDGARREINAEDVVPGDIVFIESGNKVPADLRLVSVSNLSIQEAMLTGESLPVNKRISVLDMKASLADRKNMAFSATSVVKGQATGVVVATGDETEIGKINSSVAEVKEEKTQLIKQVDAFGIWIGLMVIPIAVAAFLLAFFTAGPAHQNVSAAFIEAVAIAVAIIPEVSYVACKISVEAEELTNFDRKGSPCYYHHHVIAWHKSHG